MVTAAGHTVRWGDIALIRVRDETRTASKHVKKKKTSWTQRTERKMKKQSDAEAQSSTHILPRSVLITFANNVFKVTWPLQPQAESSEPPLPHGAALQLQKSGASVGSRGKPEQITKTPSQQAGTSRAPPMQSIGHRAEKRQVRLTGSNTHGHTNAAPRCSAKSAHGKDRNKHRSQRGKSEGALEEKATNPTNKIVASECTTTHTQ